MSEAKNQIENEIVKEIRITYKGKDEYTLDFNRESAVFAQQRGFDLSEIDVKPTILVPDLFYYSLRMHHKSLSRTQADDLREKLFPEGIPSTILKRLANLYEQASLIKLISDEELKNSDVVVEM